MLINLISYLVTAGYTAGVFYVMGHKSKEELIMAGLLGILICIASNKMRKLLKN